MQSDLKNREGRQQHEKQLSINAVQAERRRQADEKAGLQKALDAAKSSAAASEGRIRALEQAISRLQSEVDAAKAKAAALEKDLAACRAEQSKAGEQVQYHLCTYICIFLGLGFFCSHADCCYTFLCLK